MSPRYVNYFSDWKSDDITLIANHRFVLSLKSLFPQFSQILIFLDLLQIAHVCNKRNRIRVAICSIYHLLQTCLLFNYLPIIINTRATCTVYARYIFISRLLVKNTDVHTTCTLYVCILHFRIFMSQASNHTNHACSPNIFYTRATTFHRHPRLTTTEIIRRRSFRFQRPIPGVKLICRQTAAEGGRPRVFLENRSERRMDDVAIVVLVNFFLFFSFFFFFFVPQLNAASSVDRWRSMLNARDD